ncbi:MAG: hypothetical protein WC365_05865 [Candidatus Babeliales bacterium]
MKPVRKNFQHYARIVGIITVLCGVSDQLYTMVPTPQEHGQESSTAAPTPSPLIPSEGSLASLLAGLGNGNNAIDIGFILSRIQHERETSEKHTQMLNALPKELRQKISDMCAEFEALSNALRLEWSFETLATSIQKSIANYLGRNEQVVQDLDKVFEQFRTALKDGSFVESLIPQTTANPMLQLLSGMTGIIPQQKKSFDQEIALKLRRVLEAILSAYGERATEQQSVLALQIRMLRNLMVDAEKKDISALCKICARLLHERCETVRKHLKATIEVVACARSDAQQQQKAVFDYWIHYLEGYESTLSSFMSLSKAADYDLGWLLPFISRVYEVIEPVADGQWLTKSFKFNVCREGIIRTAILALATEHYYCNNAQEQTQSYMIGGSSLHKVAETAARHGVPATGPLDIVAAGAMDNAQSAMLNSPTIFAEPMHPLKLSAIRLLLALGGYHMINWNNQDWKLWPNEDKWIKFVLSVITHTSYEMLGAYGQYAIETHVSPKTLDSVEMYSAGLINTELLPTILRIAVPWIMLKTKAKTYIDKVVKFNDQDLILFYSGFYGWLFAAWAGKGIGLGVWNMGKGLWNLMPFGNHQVQPAAQPQADAGRAAQGDHRIDQEFCTFEFYIQYIIAHYLFRSLGAFSGKMIAKAYRKWFAHDDGAGLGVRQMLTEFKHYAAMVFVPSPDNVIRTTIIEVLINQGRLKREDVNKVELVDSCIFEELLHRAVQMKLITHPQAASFLSSFIKLQTKADRYKEIAALINEVFEEAEMRGALGTAGWIGGLFGGLSANILMWWHGPFFKKAPAANVQPAL